MAMTWPTGRPLYPRLAPPIHRLGKLKIAYYLAFLKVCELKTCNPFIFATSTPEFLIDLSILKSIIAYNSATTVLTRDLPI
jgi:hypothetical protein